MTKRTTAAACAVVIALGLVTAGWADPCGMVPPIYTGQGVPITRVGEQMTYVFFKDGIETLVIRPGFQGKVDEFGMLIPFPSPPAIRKVPDAIFAHIANAIDPPEVIVYALGNRMGRSEMAAEMTAPAAADGLALKSGEVRVVREEAVGMYEVAVLEAGSSAALSRWMAEHGYRYPDGMDGVCDEYVGDGWCFVAVKTRVGPQAGADPQAGQTATDTTMPSGSTFDGHVQAMGFRFQVDELVVPMRLSAFNEGELRNVVYLLTDGPRRIRNIPEEYVVRQIAGRQLYDNVTKLLPIRVIGGSPREVQRSAPWQTQGLAARRDPAAKNGAAKQLFAADLLAVAEGHLSLPAEELEKQLLNIGEHLGLRGSEFDALLADETRREKNRLVRRSLQDLHDMTLTVVDGDFPRDVVAGQNLTFAKFSIPDARNSRREYDAKVKTKPTDQPGVVVESLGQAVPRRRSRAGMVLLAGLVVLFGVRMRRSAFLACLLVLAAAVPSACVAQQDAARSDTDQLIDQLAQPEQSVAAMEQLVQSAGTTVEQQSALIAALAECVRVTDDPAQQGWAIVALSRIPSLAADEALRHITDDTTQSDLVRTWAAAGRVALCPSTDAVMEKTGLIQYFPAVARPIGRRLAEELAADGNVAVGQLIELTMRTPQLMQGLAPAILAQGTDAIAAAMVNHPNQQVRRQAAGYLGTVANQGQADEVAQAVTELVAFSPTAKRVPWVGGPLFIPGIQWEPAQARELVSHLVRWHVWCQTRQLTQEQQQISNNLFSVQLAQAAGYKPNRRGRRGTADWLNVWEDVVGRREIDRLLAEQQLDRSEAMK